MATKILAVNVLLAFGVCVFAVTLAMLLAPSRQLQLLGAVFHQQGAEPELRSVCRKAAIWVIITR
jgi:hypothetical protein